jgi:hypothetical protein
MAEAQAMVGQVLRRGAVAQMLVRLHKRCRSVL